MRKERFSFIQGSATINQLMANYNFRGWIMRTVRKCFYYVIPALLWLGSAQGEEGVATLMEVQGAVLVNQGKDYQPAQSGMKLMPNARVFTKDKASAVVTSKQGCVTRLGPNSLFVVKPVDPCHGGASAQKLAPGGYAVGEAGAGAGSAAAGGGWLGTTNGLVAVGAAGVAVVAGGVMGGLAASGGLDANNAISTPAACISPTSPECAAPF